MSVKADLGNSSFLIKSLLKTGMSHKGFYRMLGCIRHPLLVTQWDIHSSEPGNLVPLIDAVQSKYSSIPSANTAPRFCSSLLKPWRRCNHFLFCSCLVLFEVCSQSCGGGVVLSPPEQSPGCLRVSLEAQQTLQAAAVEKKLLVWLSCGPSH